MTSFHEGESRADLTPFPAMEDG